MSEWQIPAQRMSMRTSFAPTSRRSIVPRKSGSVAEGATMAGITVVMIRA
jgi:hypothetical protein